MDSYLPCNSYSAYSIIYLTFSFFKIKTLMYSCDHCSVFQLQDGSNQDISQIHPLASFMQAQ